MAKYIGADTVVLIVLGQVLAPLQSPIVQEYQVLTLLESYANYTMDKVPYRDTCGLILDSTRLAGGECHGFRSDLESQQPLVIRGLTRSHRPEMPGRRCGGRTSRALQPTSRLEPEPAYTCTLREQDFDLLEQGDGDLA